MNSLYAFRFIVCFFLLLSSTGCSKEQTDDMITPPSESSPDVLSYQTGRNAYQIDVDGTSRNFFVHVPHSYSDDTPTPIVFMIHGSGGSGSDQYDTSGWKEVADQHGFIVVFPTALTYFVETIGRNQTKWSAGGLAKDLPEGTEIIDDIPFFTRMLELLQNTFTVDDSRIYANGFSNGGGFVASRLMVEMTSVWAAVAGSGSIGLPQAYALQGDEPISFYSLTGNTDDKKLVQAEAEKPFPMHPDSIMAHPFLRNSIGHALNALHLQDSYQSQVEAPYFSHLSFRSTTNGESNEFRFTMVKDMGHIWARGGNHPSGMKVAEVFWDFFKEKEK